MKAARVYARELKWAVVPLHDVTSGRCSCGRESCPSSGKHPRIKEWEKEASADLAAVNAWIERWPRGNVGIATGTASGFFAFDVDPDHGGDEALAEIVAEHGALPATPEQITGSGGRHYLFRLPDFVVTNTARRVGKGLDTRGEGGQIVVAPSRSLKGSYRWVEGRAPWDTEIAEAPAWLLERLSRQKASLDGGSLPAAAVDRGFFPPASPEVLEQARAALAEHGPGPERVDGEGGGQHAVQAGAILMHDFALTEDEAWPLFVAWNETRTPPFPHDELRQRLRRGLKYGKADFGKMRWLDAHARATKLIADWQTAGAAADKMQPLVQSVRTIVAAGVDPVVRSLIEVELEGATALPKRALDLPRVAPPVKGPRRAADEIEITPRLHEVADHATKAIKQDLFQRNGVLCEVVTLDARQAFVHDVETPRIQDFMSWRARWTRTESDGTKTEQPAPLSVATILHSRRGHANVRVLDAVTTAPVFLADGSILQARGYSESARLYLEPSVSVDVPDEPTKQDAREAITLLHDLVGQFAFRERADFSSWVAGLLSPLVKSATGNAPTPLICVSASSPGAGKSLLTDLISQIVTGEKAELSPYNPRDPSEWGKRLTAFVKAASPVRVLDNCNGPIGDEALDRLITSSRWSDRILGASEAPPLPNVTTWLATGNNIEPVGDTVRRVLMCRIEVDTERPQERKGFKYDLEGGYAVTHRSELLSAALTVLRAWHVAGRPRPELASWGSFTAWSDVVRAAIVWTGLPDPFLTQRRASAEFNEADGEQHDFWLSVIEDCDGLAGSIVALANQRDASTILGVRDQITSYNLKKFVARFVDKPRGSKRIRRESSGRNQAKFYVETITRSEVQ